MSVPIKVRPAAAFADHLNEHYKVELAVLTEAPEISGWYGSITFKPAPPKLGPWVALRLANDLLAILGEPKLYIVVRAEQDGNRFEVSP